MKKVLLVLAAALVMVACNKKTNEPTQDPNTPKQDTTVINSLIYDQFSEILPLVCMTKTNYEAAMVKAGWEKYSGTETFIKYTDNTCSQVTSLVNSSDVVYQITCGIFPYMTDGSKYEPKVTCKHVKEAVKKIGTTFEMGADKTGCRFLATYNNIGGVINRNPNEFEINMDDNNLNASKTYYLSNDIQSWNPESTTPFVGVSMNINSYNVSGSTATEYSVAFVFSDMNKK